MSTSSATDNTTRTVLRAEGFSCPSCVSKIEKKVGRLDGVESVKVHFASARIEIVHCGYNSVSIRTPRFPVGRYR